MPQNYPSPGYLKALFILILLLTLPLSGCMENDEEPEEEPTDFREEMRKFVINISLETRVQNPNFIIIPQNGHELLTRDKEPNGTFSEDYLAAITGVGREDLFYGYEEDDAPTPAAAQEEMLAFMDLARREGIQVLTTDYCETRVHVNDSYQQNAARDYISFAADHRELDNIPAYPEEPWNLSSSNISTLEEARNFLYLINPDSFESKDDFFKTLVGTSHDVLIIDATFNGEFLTASDVTPLKTKDNGGSRLVIAYMSIGEAEDYRYYWQETWKEKPPSWLAGENPNWEGNYKVRYWDTGWQELIMGKENSYLTRLLEAGFSGVYLDIIDAYEYFEEK